MLMLGLPEITSGVNQWNPLVRHLTLPETKRGEGFGWSVHMHG